METDKGTSVGEEWIKKKLNITHENLGNKILYNKLNYKYLLIINMTKRPIFDH